MVQRHLSAKQRSPEHETARAAHLRHRLIGDRFVTPDEDVPHLDHSHEEIPIFPSAAEFRPEYRLHAFQDTSSKQHVSGAAFGPWNDKSSLMSRSIVELAFYHPCRRLRLVRWLHWPQHTRSVVLQARFK